MHPGRRAELHLSSKREGGGSISSGAALQCLADRPGLPYHRTSYRFSDALGIPLESYLAWQKQIRIFDSLLDRLRSLTNVAHGAGLPDSTYLSRL